MDASGQVTIHEGAAVAVMAVADRAAIALMSSNASGASK